MLADALAAIPPQISALCYAYPRSEDQLGDNDSDLDAMAHLVAMEDLSLDTCAPHRLPFHAWPSLRRLVVGGFWDGAGGVFCELTAALAASPCAATLEALSVLRTFFFFFFFLVVVCFLLNKISRRFVCFGWDLQGWTRGRWGKGQKGVGRVFCCFDERG